MVGESQRLTVVAPPGTGKSRLLDEVAELADGRGVAVRRARVRPDVLSAFRPLVELVEHALADAGLGGPEAIRRKLVRVTRSRARRLSSRPSWQLSSASAENVADTGDAEARRSARFAAWSTGIAALDDRPELWLLEDVHWSGSDYRAFLSAATDGRRPPRRLHVPPVASRGRP